MLSINKRSLALLFSGVSLTLLSALAGAGEWQLNMTEGVTSISKEVYGLHMLIFYICCAIGVLVFGAMFISMYLHRKSRGAEASHFHESVKLELLWTIVPALILIGMAFPATKTLTKIYDTDNADLDILVTGYQWKWKYEYIGQDVSFFANLSDASKAEIFNGEAKSEHYLLDTDKVLMIPTGKKVRFLVTSADVIHSWWVADLAVKRDAIPGYINESWTRVDEPGLFRGQCAELCGKDHGFMPIVVKAVTPEEFDAWLAQKREEAAAIAEAAKQTLSFDELYAQGEAVYNSQCSACHQPDGKGIAGTFPAIAGSPLAMGDVVGHLDRVINGGQGMPPFGEQLTPVEAAAVITFQRNAFGNNMGDQVQPIDVVNFKQGQ
ncbi:cytochrome c oxidase subunit II [Saccharophagus degradans]|uniref:Cytochrome c oxidase subunit 2 n=1 Tax=Saccharophagus degradans (strain 2-40 / ATCC 43961 / DSM 17024) TaxID=203122 RepID=Q21PS9_SACD2|nr:cytochrome c oxidase subunit II [Saccharophagus degradans]ABD79300.1 cytochrome c oxidase, subunit II [Saccharophagus degradans 2-40]